MENDEDQSQGRVETPYPSAPLPAGANDRLDRGSQRLMHDLCVIRRRLVAVLAIGSATCAATTVLFWPDSELWFGMLILACLWFMVPQARSDWKNDAERRDVLIEARREALVAQFFQFGRALLVLIGAVFASLLVLPLGLFLYDFLGRQYWLTWFVVAAGFVAFLAYPFAAGFLCERGALCQSVRFRAIYHPAQIVHWGGSHVHAFLIGVARRPVALVALVAAPLTGVFVALPYIVAGTLAKEHAFDVFSHAGVKSDLLAIATVVTLAVGNDVVTEVRSRAKTVAAAVGLLILTYSGSLLALWATSWALRTHAHVATFGTASLAGCFWGLAWVGISDLAQAIGAGIVALRFSAGVPPDRPYWGNTEASYNVGRRLASRLAAPRH